MLRRDFQVLSSARVREARTLLRARLYDGAYHLGGLAIENALKACIARATQRYEFPDRQRANRAYIHDLEDLLRAAGLEPQLRSADPTVQTAWAKAKDWNIESRYHSGKSAIEVTEFLGAITGRNGVLQWVRRFW